MISPRLLALLCAMALSACANGGGAPSSGQALADSQTRQACRDRVNSAFEVRNRAQIYAPQSQVNTPYSGSYLPDQDDRGLSDQFEHDTMLSNCIRNTGTGEERSTPAPVPVAKPAN
jgi:hypothetical protein